MSSNNERGVGIDERGPREASDPTEWAKQMNINSSAKRHSLQVGHSDGRDADRPGSLRAGRGHPELGGATQTLPEGTIGSRNQIAKDEPIRISGFHNFGFGGGVAALGLSKFDAARAEPSSSSYPHRGHAMEGMLTNSSIVTIHLDNFDSKSSSANAGEQNEDVLSKHDPAGESSKKPEYLLMHRSRNSPEPSTSVSHSPPLACGSGSHFQISQKSQNSQYSRSNQSPAGISGEEYNEEHELGFARRAFLEPALAVQTSPSTAHDHLADERDQIFQTDHPDHQGKKILRNPFSSQRRKRSEPSGGFPAPYQEFSHSLTLTGPMNESREEGRRPGPEAEFKSSSSKTNEALKLINPEKFIQQNNFIPVPSMMMNTSKSPGPIINQYTYTQGGGLMGPGVGSRDQNVSMNLNTSSHHHPMLMTSPHFFNFFESGENMSRERFAKSREQALRNENRARKQIFAPTLNRINTIERVGALQDIGGPPIKGPVPQGRPNDQNMSVNANARVPGEVSPIYCAPQGIFTTTSKSPFPRRTRILANDDNGEMAASEEQGGSSERSGSLGLANYRGEGIINVSTEILNSNIDNQEESMTINSSQAPNVESQSQPRQVSNANIKSTIINQSRAHGTRKQSGAPKKQRTTGPRISKAAINFLGHLSKENAFSPTNYSNQNIDMSSVESLSPPESVVCVDGRTGSDQIAGNGSRSGNALPGQATTGSSATKKKAPSFSGKPHHNAAASSRQNSIAIGESLQAQPEAYPNVRDSQIMPGNNQRSNSRLKRNVLVVPKKMIDTSQNQNTGSSKPHPFQPSKQAASNGPGIQGPQASSKDFTKPHIVGRSKKSRKSTFNQTTLQLSWASLHSSGVPNNGDNSPRQKFGSNRSSSKSPSGSPSNGKISPSPYAFTPITSGLSPANKSDRSLRSTKHTKNQLSRSPSSDSNNRGGSSIPNHALHDTHFQSSNQRKYTSKKNIESIYKNSNQLQSLQSLSANTHHKHKVKSSANHGNSNISVVNQANAQNLSLVNSATASVSHSRQSKHRKKSAQIGDPSQNLQQHQNILQTQFGFGFGSPTGMAPQISQAPQLSQVQQPPVKKYVQLKSLPTGASPSPVTSDQVNRSAIEVQTPVRGSGVNNNAFSQNVSAAASSGAGQAATLNSLSLVMQQAIPPACRKKSISFAQQTSHDGQQVEVMTPSQKKMANAGLGSAATEQERDRIFHRFSSRSKNFKQPIGGQGHLGPLTGVGGAGGSQSPHSAANLAFGAPGHPQQLQPIENMYNLQFCNPVTAGGLGTGSSGGQTAGLGGGFALRTTDGNPTGTNIESSQDLGQLEGDSQFIQGPAGLAQLQSKSSVNRVLNFNRALNNSRDMLKKASEDPS